MQIHVGTLTIKISLKTLQVQTFSLAPAEKKKKKKEGGVADMHWRKWGFPKK